MVSCIVLVMCVCVAIVWLPNVVPHFYVLFIGDLGKLNLCKVLILIL